jgi:phage gpG-like protein
MQAKFTLKRDTISPHLLRQLRKAQNPAPALRAAGMVLVEMAKRSFDDPALRAASWPALKPATIKAKARAGKSSTMLKSSGTLWRSLRVIGVDKTRVTVGSDRPYAAFHQLGTRHIPSRPFFPVTSQGNLTPLAKERVNSAIETKLAIKE